MNERLLETLYLLKLFTLTTLLQCHTLSGTYQSAAPILSLTMNSLSG